MCMSLEEMNNSLGTGKMDIKWCLYYIYIKYKLPE